MWTCGRVAYGLNRRERVTDTAGITLWLAVIGLASLLQVKILIGAAVAGLVAYRRATQGLGELRRQTLEPVVRRVTTVLDDVHEVAGRVQAVDDRVRDAMSRTAGRVGQASTIVGTKFWPVLGVARGIWAAVDALRRHRARAPRPQPVRPL